MRRLRAVLPLASRPQRRCLAQPAGAFSAALKEQQLQAEAQAWGAPSTLAGVPTATQDDIPVIDLGPLAEGRPEAVAPALRRACLEVGFHFVVGHGVPSGLLEGGVQAMEALASLAPEAKMKYEMDSGSHPGGTGYLPLRSFKLPKRRKGNMVESFIVKREHGPRNVTLESMPWPRELGPEWRRGVEGYAASMEALALRMMPAYSLALNEGADWLTPALCSPLWRLRLSRYPGMAYEEEQYGIGPHVDTSLLTLLHRAEREPCLVVWSARTSRWVRAPSRPGALLVNSGEILRQISNDTFLSARHYVLNEGERSRVALAFFFNATADFRLAVAPGAGGGPPKYPPTSYLDGQGVAQGE